VLKQSHTNIDLIIVDDGSTDETETIVNRFCDERLRYVRLPRNHGACAARNKGFALARGEYVALLDSDDEWLPRKLELQIEAIRESRLPHVGVVTCGFRACRLDGRTVTWVPHRSGWLFEDILAQHYSGWGPPLLLFKRELLDSASVSFDERLKARQGWDFGAQIAKHAQMEIVSEPLVIVHDHQGDRAWTPSRALEAGLYLHEKYQAELLARPRAHSKFHLRIAADCLSGGAWHEARQQVLAAVAANPSWPIAHLWMILYAMPLAVMPNVFRSAVVKVLGRCAFWSQ
jgi:glycosyltransferase involved in cell wall biosynthesis